MVPLFLALGVWLLLVSLAAFFIVKNMPVEEVAVEAEKVAQAQAVAAPISDEEFVQRLESIVKSYAKKKISEQTKVEKAVNAKAGKRMVLNNLLPLEMAFYFNNPVKGEGAFARNLDEFLDTLKEAPQEVVDFHMREDVNDFEDWVRNVIKDMELAEELRKIKEEEGPVKEKIVKAIEKSLKKKLVLKNTPRPPKDTR